MLSKSNNVSYIGNSFWPVKNQHHVRDPETSSLRFMNIHMIKNIFLVLSFLLIGRLFGQNTERYIYLDDMAYRYLDYRINSGAAVPGFVFYQPYDVSVLQTDDKSGRAGAYFDKIWQRYYGQGEVSGQLDAGDEVRYNTTVFNRYRVRGGVHFVHENITLANRTAVDQDYKHDPDYAGDLSESGHWLYGRVNEAYINLNFGGFNAFFGRVKRNWGPIRSSSLILSDNPYTYDHFLFAYTYKIMKVSLIFGRLEDMHAWRIVKTGQEPLYIPNARKYFTGHRLDLAFSDKFQAAFTEMAVYGGEDRDFEFAFLNPMNFYYGIQRNDRKQMNGMWSLDLFYKPWRPLTLYGQFFIDDIIVNNDPGVDDRARYPDRFGVLASARTGDWLTDGLSLELTYNRIWNRTYQSKATYENFQYRGLGMGYPVPGCEEGRLKIGYWGWFPLYTEGEFLIGRYGAVSVTDLFPLEKEPFPLPPVTNNMLAGLELHYFLSPLFNAHARFQYLKDRNLYLNRIDQFAGFSVTVGIQIVLAGGLML